MTTENLDERNLSAVVEGGQVHEDLMDRIWDISPEDLPFTDMCMTGTSDNHYKEFVEEQLEPANPDNKAIDGADADNDESVLGQRKGSYHQISTKTIKVSDRARNVNTVAAADELVKQVAKRQRALRRDVEARLTSNRPTVAGDANTVESECAGVGAWIGSSSDVGQTVNSARAAAGGASDPALSGAGGVGGAPVTGPEAGTKEALTEAKLKSMIRAAYENGGNLRYAMGRPPVIELLSDYMFTSSARVATMMTNAPQGNRQGVDGGNGAAGGGVTAQGAVNIYVSNFGTVIFVPNRFQPGNISSGTIQSGQSDLFLLDPDLWEVSYLQGYRTKTLGDTGLSAKRLISVDYTLCGLAELGNAVIADIDEALPMTAT